MCLVTVCHFEQAYSNVEASFILQHRKLIACLLAFTHVEKLGEGFHRKLVVFEVIHVHAIQKYDSFISFLMQVKELKEVHLSIFLLLAGRSDEHWFEVLDLKNLLESVRLIKVRENLYIAVQYVRIFAFVLLSLRTFALLEFIEHANKLLVIHH